MSEIAAEIKREEERSEALDREISSLLAELNKYEMANTLTDYTSEIIDQQDQQQDTKNEARSASLSIAQKSIKRVLDQTSSIYETASHFVRVLSDTVSDAEKEIENYHRRVECLRGKKENAAIASAEKVATQKLKMESFCARAAVAREIPMGLEKITSSLAKLKMDEDASFASVKADLEQTIVNINSKVQARDSLLRSIAQMESQCEKSRECLKAEKEFVRLQSVKIAEERNKTDNLNKIKAEALEKVLQTKTSLKTLRASQNAAEKQLSTLKNESVNLREKLSQLRADRTALEEKITSDELSWQRDLSIKKKEYGVKLADLERKVVNQQEDLHLTKCRLEVLRERFAEKGKWTEEEWRQALQGQSDDRARLSSQMTNYMVVAEELRKELADNTKENSYEEAVLALERDLLAFTERLALEKKIMQERRLKVLSNLNSARERVAKQQELYSAMRDEYEKLLSEKNNIQAQIDAFTSLRTPSKPVEHVTTTAVSTRKSSTKRRRRVRKQLDSDSDDGSLSSSIPEVEGLKPFSPATISLKEQKRNESSRGKKQKSDSREVRVEHKAMVVSGNEVQVPHVDPIPVVSQQKNAEQHTAGNRENSGDESESGSSDSENSPPRETLVSKRFPNDIFLKKTPSIDGIDSAVSPNVSANGTLLETDSDQSIWSCASPKRPPSPMDTTLETDLDQSIW